MLISLSKFFDGIFLLFAKFFPAMVLVEPNRYLSYLSSWSERILGRIEESEASNRSIRARSTRCQNIRRKIIKRMEFFLGRGGSCSYDDETIGDIKVPLR